MRYKYYAVARGAKTGIFRSWSTVSKHVIGYSSACYQGFNDEAEARNFLKTKALESLDFSLHLDDSCDTVTKNNLQTESSSRKKANNSSKNTSVHTHNKLPVLSPQPPHNTSAPNNDPSSNSTPKIALSTTPKSPN